MAGFCDSRNLGGEQQQDMTSMSVSTTCVSGDLQSQSGGLHVFVYTTMHNCDCAVESMMVESHGEATRPNKESESSSNCGSNTKPTDSACSYFASIGREASDHKDSSPNFRDRYTSFSPPKVAVISVIVLPIFLVFAPPAATYKPPE